MKLFSILAISAGATSFNKAFLDGSKMRSFGEGQTNYDDFLAQLRTRYIDLELRQHDNSDRFLRKSIMKTVRLMQRKKEAMQRKGCLHMDSVIPYDMTVDDNKKCNVFLTLMKDVQLAAIFFLGSDPYDTAMAGPEHWPEQCEKMISRFEPIFLGYSSYFANNELPSCP